MLIKLFKLNCNKKDMKKIHHETVNYNIIQYLNNLGYSDFYQDFENNDSKEYYVEMTIDGFDFEVMVEIERCNKTFMIYKDREYYDRKYGVQFAIKNGSQTSKSLQQLFNEWLDGYFKEYPVEIEKGFDHEKI